MFLLGTSLGSVPAIPQGTISQFCSSTYLASILSLYLIHIAHIYPLSSFLNSPYLAPI